MLERPQGDNFGIGDVATDGVGYLSLSTQTCAWGSSASGNRVDAGFDVSEIPIGGEASTATVKTVSAPTRVATDIMFENFELPGPITAQPPVETVAYRCETSRKCN